MSDRTAPGLSAAPTSWQMAADDAEEYTVALGQIMSGGWRQIALAQRLGVPAALGMTTEAWVSERIGGYVRLGLDERREAARALTDPDGEFQLSQREAADVLGVSPGTINSDLHGVQNRTAKEPQLEEDAGSGVQNRTPSGELRGDDLDDDDDWVDVPDLPDRAADDGEPEQPTMGEILGGEPLVFDDSGLHEEIAAHKRQQRAATLLIEMLRFAENLPPEVMTEGIRPEHLPVIAGELGVVVEWLGHARRLAHDPRAQIRRVPS